MKIVFDTNVLIAAFISRGACTELLEYCVRQHDLATSEFILKEFRNKLLTRFKISRREVAQAVALLRTRMLVVEPADLGERICRDPDDDWVLATAVAAEGRCVVTGDKDLLIIRRFQDIEIVSPNQFWRFEAEG